jgi:hypothetical protein
MIKNWIQAIDSILLDANQNRFNEQINELQELYGLRDSEYDELNIMLTGIFNKELDIEKAILFKYWIFTDTETRIHIPEGQVSLRLNTAIANVSMPDGRYCCMKIACAADPYSNTLYILSAEAYINFS